LTFYSIFILIFSLGYCFSVYSQTGISLRLNSLKFTSTFDNNNFRNIKKGFETDDFFAELNDSLKINYYNKKMNSGSVFKMKNKAAGFFDGFNINVTGGYLEEIEETYNTGSIYQNYRLNKQISNKLKLGITTRVEYARRDEQGRPIVKKWFDNSVLKGEYSFNPFNTVSIFCGGSISDTTFTAYGTSYMAKVETDEIEIKNSLTLSYDYFYYWNKVSQNFIDENLEFKYNDFKISAGYFFGIVDYNFIENYEAKARNPNSIINFEMQYRIFSKPSLNVGFYFNYRDFKYHSPLYFSPGKRSLSGIFTNFFDMFGRVFLYFGGGMRVDNENVFIWDVDSEVGYDNEGFSVSVGLSRYNDPFYTNYNTFLNLTKSF